jgi:hypothetical protein
VGAWIDLGVEHISRMVDVTPIDTRREHCFVENETAASAQNYNFAIALELATDWMRGRSPHIIAMMSNVSESEAHRIGVMPEQRAPEMAKYLED